MDADTPPKLDLRMEELVKRSRIIRLQKPISDTGEVRMKRSVLSL